MRFLYEATRQYVNKVVDPALMTFDEYRSIVDPDRKSHPSESYQTNIDKLNSFHSPSDYENLLNTITRNGIVFEIREHAHDRRDGKYVKTDQSGNIIRDKDDKAMFMTADEIAIMIPEEKRFSYEYAVVDKEKEHVVAVTQDEWGTVLVMTAEEYRGFGFAALVAKLKYTAHPTKSSGGFTSAGFATFRRMHSEMVRDYVSSGMYSHLVNTGVMTAKRAKEIIDSVSMKRSAKNPVNLNTSNPRDWLVMINDSVSYAIIYDKKIYELPEDKLDDNFWIERFIKGSISIDGREPYHVAGIAGDSKIMKVLLEIMLNGEIGSPLIFDRNEYSLVKDLSGLEVTKSAGDNFLVTLNKPTLDLQKLSNVETRYRKMHDKYEEMAIRIQELADAMRYER